MSPVTDGADSNKTQLRAEFDSLAEEYYEQHKANIKITGEEPEYFAEYKIADLASLVRDRQAAATDILDFGCGIGNSVPFFRRYFATSKLYCSDVSARSIEIAKMRFGHLEEYLIVDNDIPLPQNSVDIVFSACVFHHIPHSDHHRWLTELRRVTRPGGALVIYEHNPRNPLTRRAVRTCALDVNARLIKAGRMCANLVEAGWEAPEVDYKLFFPAALKLLRPLEGRLAWIPIGAQYRVSARRPR